MCVCVLGGSWYCKWNKTFKCLELNLKSWQFVLNCSSWVFSLATGKKLLKWNQPKADPFNLNVKWLTICSKISIFLRRSAWFRYRNRNQNPHQPDWKSNVQAVSRYFWVGARENKLKGCQFEHKMLTEPLKMFIFFVATNKQVLNTKWSVCFTLLWRNTFVAAFRERYKANKFIRLSQLSDIAQE